MWWWILQFIYSVVIILITWYGIESIRTVMAMNELMFIWFGMLLCSILQEIHNLKEVIERERCN